MHITDEFRQRFMIARTMEEIISFSHAARLGNQIGFPVLIIPFGAPEEEGVLVEAESQLMSIGPGMLQRGAFGFVHVIKATNRRN